MPASPRRLTPGHRLAAALLPATVALVLAGCSSQPTTEAAAATSTIASTLPATTAVATTSTSSTIPSTTSTSTTSTTSTTVAETLPQPIAPPTDEYGQEPVVELGTISIPKIGVDATMYEGIRLTTLDRGPGHWPGSAMPGQIGNTVVAGHRVSKHHVFRRLDELEPGDEIVFGDTDGDHVYAVDHTEIVEPDAIWIVEPTPTATATLFACHPPGSTTQRIVVFAHLVDG